MQSNGSLEGASKGHGKILLAGEHAVVYGSRALAAPLPAAIFARLRTSTEPGVQLHIPAWGVACALQRAAPPNVLHETLDGILRDLGVDPAPCVLEVEAQIPRAAGLGASAALAVAVTRAVAAHCGLSLTEAQIDGVAFAAERRVHGTPSGVDNALATYGEFLLFKKGDPPQRTRVEAAEPLVVVVGLSGVEGLTASMVAKVRRGWVRHGKVYERIFAEIDSLAVEAAHAVECGDLRLLGELMNLNHGLLSALQVSCVELEQLVHIARRHGALGAKLTGGGGGGAIIALCPDDPYRVQKAMRAAGYESRVVTIGASRGVSRRVAV